MEIRFRKLSNQRHSVTVNRPDGSTETVELESKDFLRHDFVHLAVETEFSLESGVWGSVAKGGSLDGSGLDGEDIWLAERLSGPMQTMMRTEAPAETILLVLEQIEPDRASVEVASALRERFRSLRGHWAGTPFGKDMVLHWPL